MSTFQGDHAKRRRAPALTGEEGSRAVVTALLAALQQLGIRADVELGGRWAAIRGERATVYVIEAGWGDSFYVWCDLPEERAVERYRDPIEAIQTGLRRASHLPSPAVHEADPPTER
jgi:hypothetical protein